METPIHLDPPPALLLTRGPPEVPTIRCGDTLQQHHPLYPPTTAHKQVGFDSPVFVVAVTLLVWLWLKPPSAGFTRY